MSLTSGSRIGVYEVGSLVGAGGMGEVYRATDTRLKRQVALKVLPPDVATHPERLARFQREAELLAAMNHPNIAAIYGIEESGGTTAIVMELVEGTSLANVIATGPVPLDGTLHIAAQISDALEAAHDRGIIHRDLKPANIVVRQDGTVKVLDFGLAKAIEGAGHGDPPAATGELSASPTLTSPALMTGVGVLLGTAAYMSPEQAKGKTVDLRTDVWAFGAVLFEMLTGMRPFAADDVPETLAAILRGTPDWSLLPATTPPAVRRLLRRCLEKDARSRLSSMAMARLELSEAKAELSHPAAAAPAAPPRARWQLATAISLVAIGAAAAGAVVATYRRPTLAPQPVMRFTIPLSEPMISGARSTIAISPDGMRYVWAAQSGLLLKNASDIEPVRLVAGGSAAASQALVASGSAAASQALAPFFSPDGQWVGFFQGGQIKKVSVSGGAPVKISDVPGAAPPVGVVWSDDEILAGLPVGIVRESANGGRAEVIVPNDKDTVAPVNPQWLPGRKWLLFMSAPADDAAPDNFRVMAVAPATKQRKVLVEGARFATYVPTGHLVYGRGNDLLAVPFNADDATIHGSPVPVLQGVAASTNPTMQVAVSANGTLVYLPGTGSGQVTTRLALVARNGTRSDLIDVPGVAWFPRFSPDGKRIAYGMSSGPELTTASDLWVVDAARGARTRVTFSANNRFYPIWTRDGRHLTFADGTSLTNRLQWALADGSGGLETLIDVDTRRYPTSWSPDGKTLAFYVGGASSSLQPGQTNNSRDIWMLHVDGAKRTQTPFITGPFEERGGIFSPDGRWVAYVSNKSGQNDVYARPFPGPGDEVTISVGGGQEPVWAPSGKELFYRHGGKLQSVRIEEAAGSLKIGAPVPLFDDAFIPDRGGAQGGMANYDIAPDGEHFAVVVEPPRTDQAANRQLQVVLNWSEELKQRVPTR